MILLTIFFTLTTIFTGVDLHKAQKELNHQNLINKTTVEECGEAWLKKVDK